MNTRTVKTENLPDVFPKGAEIATNFTGQAWLAMLVNSTACDIAVYNVTFAPGCRNNWHTHAVGQILLCTAGDGYYQERGRPARRLRPGDVVEILAATEHWHGAAPDRAFAHIGITPKMGENRAAWIGPVTDEEYAAATATASVRTESMNCIAVDINEVGRVLRTRRGRLGEASLPQTATHSTKPL